MQSYGFALQAIAPSIIDFPGSSAPAYG